MPKNKLHKKLESIKYLPETTMDQPVPIINKSLEKLKKRGYWEIIIIKFSFLSGESFKLSVSKDLKFIDLIPIIDKYTSSRSYSFIYDREEVDIYDKITKYYSVEGELSINIIYINIHDMFYPISNFNSRYEFEHAWSLASKILYDLNHIVLTNIDYSCTGVPILVDICPCDKIKYGCRCNSCRCMHDHAYEYSQPKCLHSHSKKLQIDPNSICCDIFQLPFSDLCMWCKKKLMNLLLKIMLMVYNTESKILQIIKNELFENFIIRFEEFFK